MIRKVKVLGLALVAVFAMSAMVAQAASATVVNHEFASDATETIIKGTDEPGTNNVFDVNGAEVVCATSHFEGTVLGAEVDHVTVHPTYTDCEFFGSPATVTTTGCNYTFDSDTIDSEHADVFVECTGTGIVIQTDPCTIVVGEQTTEPGVTYTNIANGDVTVKATVPDIEAHSWEGPLCFLLEDEGTITGEYTGEVIIEGINEANNQPTNIAITTP